MSLLRDSDERYHWQDGMHRWDPPDGVDVEDWRAEVAAHLEAHRERPSEGYMLPRRARRGGSTPAPRQQGDGVRRPPPERRSPVEP